MLSFSALLTVIHQCRRCFDSFIHGYIVSTPLALFSLFLKYYDPINRYPANFPSAISIGAVAKKDNLPMARFTNTNSSVDYCGIGVDVVSFRPDGAYQYMSGTSMATPHVCGLICALMDKQGKYVTQITDDGSCRRFLDSNCLIDVGAEGKDNATGLGFVTYLTKDEFEKDFLDLPEYSS